MIESNNNHLMLSDKTYNFGKTFVQVLLPAFASLYFGLAGIWELPAADQIVGTCAIVATFLGVILGVSNRQYVVSGAKYDGQMIIVEPEEGPKVFSLELNGEPEDLVNREAITFKVQTSEPPHQELG